MPAIRRKLILLVIWLSACNQSESSISELRNRILAEIRRGNLPSAHHQLEEIHSHWRRDPKSEWYWRFRLLDAELGLAEGKAGYAANLLTTSIPQIPNQTGLETQRHIQLAYVDIRMGKYDDASKLLDEAAAMPAPDKHFLLEIEVGRGLVAARKQPAAVAERRIEDAYRHAVELKDFYYQAVLLNNLGSGRVNRFRYDEAIPYLQRALAAADQCGAALVASSALGNLASCSYRLGDFDTALQLRQKAADLQRKIGARAKLQVSLGEFGNIQYLQGHPAKAIPFYRQAVDIAREVQDRDYAAVWAANLASAYAETHDWDAAAKMNGEIRRLGLAPDPRLDAELKFIEAAIAAGRGNSDQAIALYKALLLSGTGDPSVLWQAHAELADVYSQTNRSAEAAKHFEKALLVIGKTRSQLLQNDYKITFLNGLIRFHQRYVDFLVSHGDCAKALDVAESSRALLLAEKIGVEPARRSADYRSLAKAMGAGILCYWLAPEKSYLWVITPERIGLVPLPAQDTIARLAEAHNKAILEFRDPLAIAQPASKQLFDVLVGSAKSLLGVRSRVVLVPDGVLHGVNFETLPAGDHYWIEDVALAIAPSLNVLEQADSHPQKHGSLLFIGDPEYRSPEFPKLEHAAEELAGIRRVINESRITHYAHADAQPSSYSDSSPSRFGLIHFAAHAVASAASPLDSAIILAPDKREKFKLYARDVLDIPLHAGLVTISACRSAGKTSYAGEGLVGLAWAFMYAGAHNVIAGLWDVNDKSTAQIMTSLYASLEGGKEPVDALREAKLAMLHTNRLYSKPYYWAPFQTYVRARPWQRS